MGLYVELMMSVLLVATCGYCAVLGRKLRDLREGQRQLIETVEKFDAASRRAEKNLQTMQGAGLEMNKDLDAMTRQANGLIDELSVMVHAGDKIAGRIETAVGEVRILGGAKHKNRERLAS